MTVSTFSWYIITDYFRKMYGTLTTASNMKPLSLQPKTVKLLANLSLLLTLSRCYQLFLVDPKGSASKKSEQIRTRMFSLLLRFYADPFRAPP